MVTYHGHDDINGDKPTASNDCMTVLCVSA